MRKINLIKGGNVVKLKSMIFVGVLSLILAFGGVALAYEAPKVAAPLELGKDWPVDADNAYSHFSGDNGWNVWVFWDDSNVYLQYDVYTDLPMGNNYDEHSIWQADSLEWEINVSGVKEKWIIALTSKGYQIVTRQPRAIIKPGEGAEVLIKETDFGYSGQVILDRSHPNMSKFAIAPGFKVDMAVQINDSKDGTDRTRILGGFVDAGRYSDLVFVD